MSDSSETCLPTTNWFLYSENGKEPLGSIYRKSLPEVGGGIEEDSSRGIKPAQIVSVTELRATCAMRRFKVIVRPLP